jgi:DNA topoisomerase-1
VKPEDIEAAQAIELIDARAAKAPTKKKRKKAAPKKKKAPAKKKAAAKKG